MGFPAVRLSAYALDVILSGRSRYPLIWYGYFVDRRTLIITEKNT